MMNTCRKWVDSVGKSLGQTRSLKKQFAQVLDCERWRGKGNPKLLFNYRRHQRYSFSESRHSKRLLFHRTDEGTPGRETTGRRLALRNQTRWLSGTGLQRRQGCTPSLPQ